VRNIKHNLFFAFLYHSVGASSAAGGDIQCRFLLRCTGRKAREHGMTDQVNIVDRETRLTRQRYDRIAPVYDAVDWIMEWRARLSTPTCRSTSSSASKHSLRPEASNEEHAGSLGASVPSSQADERTLRNTSLRHDNIAQAAGSSLQGK
jgi:hypothetical protein